MDSLISELNELLPLDKESLTQCLNYGFSLRSNDEVHDYFSGLVGESDLFFKFLEHFLSLKEMRCNNKKTKQTYLSATKNTKKELPISNSKKQHADLISIQKNNSSDRFSVTTIANYHDRNSKVNEQKSKEKMENTNMKKKKGEGIRQTTNIEDLDELIKRLEAGKETSDQTECDCMAARHPLNSVIPNCLNCGKIICVKERNRVTCSFCKEPLISLAEKLEMIRLLQKEKEEISENEKKKKMVAQKNKGKKKQQKITISMGSVGNKNFYKQQDNLFAKIEKKAKESNSLDMDKIDKDLNRAEDTLHQLLDFQDNAVQRTKIIDQVSDYDISNESSIWSKSSLHRLLALKKQQRNFKKLEKQNLERSGRGKQVLELNIKNGKAVMKSKNTRSSNLDMNDTFDDALNYGSDSSDMVVDSEDEEIKKEISIVEDKIREKEQLIQEEMIKKKWDYQKEMELWKSRRPKYMGALTDNTTSANDQSNLLKYDRIQDLNERVSVEQLVLNL